MKKLKKARNLAIEMELGLNDFDYYNYIIHIFSLSRVRNGANIEYGKRLFLQMNTEDKRSFLTEYLLPVSKGTFYLDINQHCIHALLDKHDSMIDYYESEIKIINGVI